MRQSNFLRSAALCTFGVMLTGCMHYTHKSAEGKPESGIATINLVDKSLAITSVDNDDTLFWLGTQYQYFIGPGSHRIKVRQSIAVQKNSYPVERSVELQAGRTYGLYGESWAGTWDFQIRDVQTGQRVDAVIPPGGMDAALVSHAKSP